jgi:hypothetical protein
MEKKARWAYFGPGPFGKALQILDSLLLNAKITNGNI